MTATFVTPKLENRDIGENLRFSRKPPNTTPVDQNADLMPPGPSKTFSRFRVPWFSLVNFYVFWSFSFFACYGQNRESSRDRATTHQIADSGVPAITNQKVQKSLILQDFG